METTNANTAPITINPTTSATINSTNEKPVAIAGEPARRSFLNMT
jgi:hypothetical protein